MLYEQLLGRLVALGEGLYGRLLLGLGQGRGQRVAAADVVYARRVQAQEQAAYEQPELCEYAES